jgi:hypothetical protein
MIEKEFLEPCKKHTRGEWTVPHFAEDGVCKCGFVFGYEGERVVAEVKIEKRWDKYGQYPQREEAIANAHLISMAPELLKEVIELQDKNAVLLGHIKKAMVWYNLGKYINVIIELSNAFKEYGKNENISDIYLHEGDWERHTEQGSG